MTTNQLERLRRDSKETKHYIKRMEKRGKHEKAFSAKQYQQYLDAEIEELEMKFLKVA